MGCGLLRQTEVGKHGLSRYHKGCRCDICKQALRDYKNAYYQTHKVVWRRYELFKNYGISLDDYARMFTAQKGLCAICGKGPQKNHLHVDHCHKTQKVRGLLCSMCNGNLGWLEMFEKKISSYSLRSRFKLLGYPEVGA